MGSSIRCFTAACDASDSSAFAVQGPYKVCVNSFREQWWNEGVFCVLQTLLISGYLNILAGLTPCTKEGMLPMQVGKFAFVANSRARSVDDTEGLVKFISDKKTDKILGAHIMGPNAGSICAPLLSSVKHELKRASGFASDRHLLAANGVYLAVPGSALEF